LGLVEKDLFIKAKLTDLIGKYVGHTEANVEELFKKASGGIIFLDEAYSLGNKDRPTSFSKVAIDIINEKMTRDHTDEDEDEGKEKSGKVCFFIAGYEKELNESFFSVNPGLISRFFFRFYTERSTYSQLKLIYQRMMREDGWKLSEVDPITVDFFKTNYKSFPNYGRDMQRLWQLTKMSHSKRVFGKSMELRGLVTQEDLSDAFKMFVSEEAEKAKKASMKFLSTLYT